MERPIRSAPTDILLAAQQLGRIPQRVNVFLYTKYIKLMEF